MAPELAFAWVVVLGLSLGAVFPLVLTLPLDVADDPARVGSVAALMLLGGYIVSSSGPVILGAARDLTGDFGASLWMLVAIAVALVAVVPAAVARPPAARRPSAMRPRRRRREARPAFPPRGCVRCQALQSLVD